jgi:hypothetical protein
MESAASKGERGTKAAVLKHEPCHYIGRKEGIGGEE